MSVVVGLSNIEAVSVSKYGRSGAALASVCQEGYSIARGFIISAEAFDGFLKDHDMAHAYSAYVVSLRDKKGKAEACENLLAAISETRLHWDNEMELIERFREMEGMVTLHLSTISGQAKSPLHAISESGFMDAVRELWARWVEGATLDELQNEFPAIIVQEVIESESSVEIKRKNDGFSVRAVFGQPEGLYDPSISSDHHHYDHKLNLISSEKKEQKWQHIPTDVKVSKVEVWEDFQTDPKVSEETLADLADIMSYMLGREEIEAITLMVTDEDELIIDDIIASPVAEKITLAIEGRSQTQMLIPEIGNVKEMEKLAIAEPTENLTGSTSTIQEAENIPHQPHHASPQSIIKLRTKIFVKAGNISQLSSLINEQPDGIILLGNWHEPNLQNTLAELSRSFTSSM